VDLGWAEVVTYRKKHLVCAVEGVVQGKIGTLQNLLPPSYNGPSNFFPTHGEMGPRLLPTHRATV
jgi:hypothetical protein